MGRQSLVNAAILALGLGTLGIVWLTREVPTTSELAARRGKLLPKFDKAAVTRITLSEGGREVVLEATDSGEFRIGKPWSERADIASVNQLLGALDLASALRTAEAVSPEQAGLGAQAFRLRLETSNDSQSLSIGGPAPSPSGARYAEVLAGGQTRRYVVSQGVAAELVVPLDKFREPRLLSYGRSDIASLTFTSADEKLELSQDPHGSFFVHVGADRELAEREVVERVLSALSRLVVERFVEAAEARKSIATSARRVLLTPSDKQSAPVTLSFGTCPGAQADALVLVEQAGNAPRAGCLSGELAAALQVKQGELRLSGAFAARSDEVEVLELRRGSEKLELARKDRAFVLRASANQEVSLAAGNARISAILSARGTRPSRPEKVEPSAGEMTVELAGADESKRRSERVRLGPPRADGSVCLERLADGVILCFPPEAARAFEPDATDLKGLTLFDFAPSEVSSFTVTAPGLRQVLRRTPDGGYAFDEPRGYRHDGALVDELLHSLGALQAVRWLDAREVPRAGLDSPRAEVSVTLGGDAGTRTLRVGAPTAGGYFALASSDPSPFVLSGSTYDQLLTPLIDRSLVPFPDADLERIQLESRGRSVVATRSGQGFSGPLPADAIEAILALRADRALHLGAARPAEGFAKPTLVLRFGSKQGQQARLLLGQTDASSEPPTIFCRLDGVDATFALGGQSAAMLRDSLASSERP